MVPQGTLEQFYRPFGDAMGIHHGLMDTINLFSLGLARWGPTITLSPFLGGRLVPTPIKMGLTLMFAAWLTPALSQSVPTPLNISYVMWWVLLLKEAFIGIVLGVASGLVFWAAEMGGQFLDNVRGTTTANVLIPQVSVQSSLLGDFYFQFFIVTYVMLGGHRIFLSGVFDSYRLIPPLDVHLNLSGLAGSFIGETGLMFSMLIKIIGPALVVVMMLDIMLGVANRMAPQLDVFFISLSLKATLAALMIGLSMFYLGDILPGLFRPHHQWLDHLIHSLKPLGT